MYQQKDAMIGTELDFVGLQDAGNEWGGKVSTAQTGTKVGGMG